jgi:iron-sulfur cluster assembly accessory protein
MSNASIELTDSAAARLVDLVQKENNAALMLRVCVEGGGCSGFSYQLSLDAHQDISDHVFTGAHGAKVVVDSDSYEFLAGSKIDFIQDDFGRSEFVLYNPQSTSSCGCGKSFGV